MAYENQTFEQLAAMSPAELLAYHQADTSSGDFYRLEYGDLLAAAIAAAIAAAPASPVAPQGVPAQAGYDKLKAEMLRYVACNPQTQGEVFLRFRAQDKSTWTRAEFVEALRNDEPVALDMMVSMMGMAAHLITQDAENPTQPAAAPAAGASPVGGAGAMLDDLAADLAQQLNWSTSVEEAATRVLDTVRVYKDNLPAAAPSLLGGGAAAGQKEAELIELPPYQSTDWCYPCVSKEEADAALRFASQLGLPIAHWGTRYNQYAVQWDKGGLLTLITKMPLKVTAEQFRQMCEKEAAAPTQVAIGGSGHE